MRIVIPSSLSLTRRVTVLLVSLIPAVMTFAQGETTKTMEIYLGGKARARLGTPVVVCTSEVGEKRWGRHQFVGISEYPGGSILLRHHSAEDAVDAYGTPSPTYISSDQGKTWQPFKAEGLPTNGLTYPLFDGQFICVPMAKPLDAVAEKLAMPKPAGGAFSYCDWKNYRVAECPEPVKKYMREYECARWNPGTCRWEQALMTYDIEDAIVWSPGKDDTKILLSRTCFERPPLHVGNELMYADYRSNFLQEDGTPPKKWGIACMVSADNGRTWKRRSMIARDPEGIDSLGEPMLAENVKGELVCVIRRSDHEQKSMLITYSADKGKTWGKPVALDKLGKFGVFPALVTLDCGVMVLSYGRPGIYLSFSVDGTGRDWSEPFCVLPGDEKATWLHTDAYTSLLPTGSNKLLLAYTDFDHKDENGEQRKAILVRELTVEK